MRPSTTRRGGRGGPAAAIAVLLLGGLLTACTPGPVGDATAAAPAGTPVTGSALAVLDTLAVKGRAPRTGYSREAFGPAWTDTDRNGCDSRNDVLTRDLTDVAHVPGTRGCKVSSGTLRDPYSGRVIGFTRGESTSSDVQIDHVVALSDAWQKGARQWDEARRTAFANDPLELLAVDGPENQSKGDGDAATWLPPDVGHRCAYVARQVAVKAQYGLWVTTSERDAIARVLSDCPDQQVPTVAEVAVTPSVTVVPQPTATRTAFTDCSAVWAALDGPVRRTDPGYSARLDRDGDGTACETDPR